MKPMLMARALMAAGSIVLAGQATAATQAGMSAGGELPAVLREIPRAAAMCGPADKHSGPGAAPATGRADLGCALGVRTLAAIRPGEDTVLADVRDGAAYAAAHLDGSRNLSFSDLHSKPYWRNKRVVLIGSGKGEAELYRQCAALKQGGYRDVRVLQGGVAQWLGEGQALAGRAQAYHELVRLSSRELLLEMQDPHRLLLLDPAERAMQADLPGAVVLAALDGDALRAAAERQRKLAKSAAVTGVVLVSGRPLGAEQVGRLQAALAPLPLLVYDEGRPAMAAALAQHKAIWAAHARGPKRPACGL